MKPDTKKSDRKHSKSDEIRLHAPLHPEDKKGGKGAEASREFHANCEFNVNGKK